MSNFDNQNNQRVWTPDIFNDDKLYLRGDPIQDGGWDTRMRIKKRGNNPAIEVSTGIKDKRDRQIRHDIPMSPRVLEEFLYVIEAVATYKSEISYELENWGYTYNWNAQTRKSERSENVSVIGKISIHKDATGMVGITFSFRGGKTIIPFKFTNDEYHRWMKDGNYMPDSDQSKIAALAWCKNIREVYNYMYVTKWEEPEWQKQQRIERMNKATGGGQGGGWNNNNQNRQQNSNYQEQNQQNQQTNVGGDDFTDNFGGSMVFEDVPF